MRMHPITMKSFLVFLFIFSCISCQNNDQQTIQIHINEELPLFTILFTTTTNITYRLFDSGRNHNTFIVYNTTNGHILLSKNLDREDLCSQHICSCLKCQLIIELIEWQSPYELLRLILNIEDINDQKPRFSSEIYHLNLMENVPIGFELPLEAAFDTDLGENSRIRYDLRTLGENSFELITKTNGGLALRIVKNIDREEKDFYEYDLIAYDHGQPRQQTSAKLFIQIDDMNDNPVVLSQTYYHLHISENTPFGTELLHINATDRDSGLNGQIQYSINNDGFLFRIGESNGILTLAGPLDYEIEQTYRLTVQVRDLGENSLARFVTIDITILDENDNSPQAFVTFVQSLINNSIISIVENTPIGQILAHISISDQDSGLNGQLSYRIEEGNEIIEIKKLDEKSFLLVIKVLIDREDENLAINKLVLIIFDHGKPEKSIRLEYQIHIIDINDSPPKFQSSTKCRKHLDDFRNRSLDEPLFQVQATDLDSNENGRVSYSILPPNDNLFTINDQGEIYRIDEFNESSYHLQILAMDHGKSIRLNSTYDCYLSADSNTTQNQFTTISMNIFQYRYFLVVILLLLSILIILSLSIGFYKFVYQQRQCFQPNKTYHLYVSIPRKSLYYYDQDPCDHQSDEYVHLNSDQSSEKDSSSSSSQHQFPRTVQKTNESRPVSMSISTATTCMSIGTELTNSSLSTIVQLAQEEKIDF